MSSQIIRQKKINLHDQSQNNVQNQQIQNANFSSQKIKTQKQIQVQSQHLQNKNVLQSNQYKLKLLKLMIIVRIEQTGFYNNQASRSIMQKQLQNLSNQVLMNNSLHQIAQHIYRSIMDILVEGVERIQIVRFQRRSITKIHEQEYNSFQQKIKENSIHERQIQPNRIMKEILCSICYQTSTNFCEQKCLHSFCNSCMREFIKQTITSGTYIIGCPQYNCKEQISSHTIKSLLNEAQFKRYQYFYDKHIKELNPDNKFCTRPDCVEVLKNINERNICQKCSVQYCLICNQIYHGEKPCDFVLMETLQKTYNDYNIKKCPKCQAPIQKESGCNHMHCKKCKHQFCWVCLKKYSPHHYKYYNCFGCPGMQFQAENQLNLYRFKQVIFYILLPIILITLISVYFSALPFIMIGNFLYRPLSWIKNKEDFIECLFIKKICCLCFKRQYCLCSFIAFILLWILYQPRALLYGVFVIPVKITADICADFCRNFQ